MRIIIEDKRIKEIPALEIYNAESNKKAPVIIMIHGYKGKKENLLKEAYFFARKSYFVIIFDSYLHGELAVEELNDNPYLELKTLIIRNQTIKFMNTLMLESNLNPKADSNRIGLIGISMGGIFIYKYLSQDIINSGIKAVIPIISPPKIMDIYKSNFENDSQAEKHLVGFDEISKLEIFEFEQLKKLNDLPLLMINSDNDPYSPIEIIRKSYKEISQSYSDKEKIKSLEYKGIGHILTEDMINKSWDWFNKYL